MGIYTVDKIIHIPHTGNSSEQMIPDRKNVAVVTVCMGLDIMMMKESVNPHKRRMSKVKEIYDIQERKTTV